MQISGPQTGPDAVLIALDSCADRCSVALSLPGVPDPFVMSRAMRRGHAEFLLPLLDGLIQKAGLSMNALTGIAVTRGPGSFAGVRVGIAAARGLALALGIPVIGFSVLEVLSFSARQRAGKHPCLVAIAARGDEFYVQGFDGQGLAQSEPQVMDQEACLVRFQQWSGLLTGSGAASLKAGLRAARTVEEPLELVSPLLGLAHVVDVTKWQSAPTPLYLRPPDAVLSSRPGIKQLGER